MLYTSLEVTEDNVVRARGGRLLSELLRSPRRQRTIEEVVTMELNRADLDLVTELSFLHLLLAHYRNQLLHLFVPEAMLALCLHRDTPTDIGKAQCCLVPRLPTLVRLGTMLMLCTAR